MQKVVPVNTTYEKLMGEPFLNVTQLSQYQILQILQNKEYYFNIWRSFIIEEDKKFDYIYYDKYVVEKGENWDNIAWKLYKNVHYWWILAFFNNIQNPFETLYAGQELIVLKAVYIPSLLKALDNLKWD